MPTNAILLALAAGLISAVVFASATTGPMLVRFVLFFLTPLSIYLAGLGLGNAAAAIAAVMATVLILLLASPLTAVLYALTSALPAIVTTRLMLLSRTSGSDEHSVVEWYPVGRIVAAAALFGGLFAIIVIMMMGGDIDAMTKMMRTVLDEFLKSQIANLPGAPKLTEEQITELAKTTLSTLPWVLGSLAMGTILVNLWLAGAITFASGRLVRPWPDLSAIELPAGAALAFFVALALTMVGGVPGLLAGGLAGALMIAFALVGLALAHVVTRNSPWRNFILVALYAALFVFTAPALVLLAIAGLAETIFGYRSLQSGGPPDTPT